MAYPRQNRVARFVWRLYAAFMWPSGLVKKPPEHTWAAIFITRFILIIANAMTLVCSAVWVYACYRVDGGSANVVFWSAVSNIATWAAFSSWIAVNALTVVAALARRFPSRSEEACWLAFALLGGLVVLLGVSAFLDPGSCGS